MFLSNEVFKASDFDFQTCLLTTDKICLNYKLRVAFYRRVVKEICKDVLLSPDIISIGKVQLVRFVCSPIYNTRGPWTVAQCQMHACSNWKIHKSSFWNFKKVISSWSKGLESMCIMLIISKT